MAWSERPRRRSIRCNGELLRYFRQRRRLTQEELAHDADVSVRVLAKAEANGTLCADTIESLADALSRPGVPIHPEDLVSEPRALALQFFQSYAVHERQLVANCQHLLANCITSHMAGDPAEIPFSGKFEGIDEFDRLWGLFFRTISRPDKALGAKPQVLVVEGNQVISIWSEIADLPGLPSMGRQTLVSHLQFERGRMVHLETHFDTLAAARQIRTWRSRRGNSDV